VTHDAGAAPIWDYMYAFLCRHAQEITHMLRGLRKPYAIRWLADVARTKGDPIWQALPMGMKQAIDRINGKAIDTIELRSRKPIND
jgi:hypothetical protein